LREESQRLWSVDASKGATLSRDKIYALHHETEIGSSRLPRIVTAQKRQLALVEALRSHFSQYFVVTNRAVSYIKHR
jgi:hypothetical protein